MGGVLLGPQPNNCIYYIKKLSKNKDIVYGFCPLYTNFAFLFLFFHGMIKHPYLNIGRMYSMNYGNFIMFSYSLNSNQLHDHCCHTQATVSLISCGDCTKKVIHFSWGINTSTVISYKIDPPPELFESSLMLRGG